MKNTLSKYFILLSIFMIGCGSTFKATTPKYELDKSALYIIQPKKDYYGSPKYYKYVADLTRYVSDRINKYGYKTEAKPFNYQLATVGEESVPVEEKNEAAFASGSGFFISKDGFIVTNYHVISAAETLRVYIPHEKRTFRVWIESADKNNDIAILYPLEKVKINKWLNLTTFKDSKLGDKIRLVGYPLIDKLGTDPRVSEGIVSAKSGFKGNPVEFQISAEIQPGNSGGPIVNNEFEVIGITTSKINEVATLVKEGFLTQNVNFGTKVDYAKLLLNKNVKKSILAHKTVTNSLQDVVESTVLIAVNHEKDILEEEIKRQEAKQKQEEQDRIQREKEALLRAEEEKEKLKGTYIVKYDFTTGKNIVFGTFRYFRIELYDHEGKLLAESEFKGRDFSTKSTIADKVIDRIFDKNYREVSDEE